MPTSHSVAVPREADQARPLDTPEMINRMAADLRARSDTDLPLSFYVAQVRRQLTGRTPANSQPERAVPETTRAGEAHPSVFHSWAFSD
ncbi:DNA-binding beta-propeller fold protein YncE [Neorhizobium galegae]|uniref:hypothetical protein n=1 Tax=Rhizobium/Agrobacterium group TaxID=227290 RepID=UPI001AE1B2FE|nr:hypothetical protein [Neorhizobium galegae]MBP2548854.1 DNA-binding beta-propeller fold protein YncE [Neorhizobium galegae]